MANEMALKPCPFCGALDHLSVQSVGSMAAGMPDRPYRVICTHIDHDTVVGPTAFGRFNAITAWNTRAAEPAADVVEGLGSAYTEMEAGNADCLRKRREGEPMFILLGRDPDAANIVRLWAQRRKDAGDSSHAAKAFSVAELMAGYSGEPDSAPSPSNYAALQAQPAEPTQDAIGCEFCRGGGQLVATGGHTPRCPRCDAEYPEDEQPAEPSDTGDFVRIPVEAYEFLMGQGPLEGCQFGERHPDRPGAFWWRAVIREREAAIAAMRGEA